MCGRWGGRGATARAGRLPQICGRRRCPRPTNSRKVPQDPQDLDKSSHLVDTLSSEVSSNVVTLETTRRRRQKKAASALCGLSCRRTREGGRAGRLGPSGRDGAHPRPPHRLQQTPILGPRHPTILVRGGTLKIHTSTIQHNQN